MHIHDPDEERCRVRDALPEKVEPEEEREHPSNREWEDRRHRFRGGNLRRDRRREDDDDFRRSLENAPPQLRDQEASPWGRGEHYSGREQEHNEEFKTAMREHYDKRERRDARRRRYRDLRSLGFTHDEAMELSGPLDEHMSWRRSHEDPSDIGQGRRPNDGRIEARRNPRASVQWLNFRQSPDERVEGFQRSAGRNSSERMSGSVRTGDSRNIYGASLPDIAHRKELAAINQRNRARWTGGTA